MTTMPEQQFDTPAALDLTVEIGSGSVHVVAADTTTTTVSAEGPGAERLEVLQSADALTVTQPRGRFFRDDRVFLRLTVPEGSRPVVRTGSADVTLEGRSADTAVKTGSGTVRIEHVDGAASVTTGSGNVRVGSVSGDLRTKSGSGRVQVGRVSGDASLSTGSGDVSVERADGDTAIKTGSGSARVGECSREVAFTAGSGGLRVDLARDGKVLAKSASGDVSIGVPAGLPVWTDISTVSGHVRSDVEGVGAPEEGAPRLEVHARTVSGGVHLHPAD